MSTDLAHQKDIIQMPTLYFRQAYFFFGKTPALRSAIVANTSISEDMLDNPDTLIPVTAQLQQMQNLTELIGEDFVFKAKSVWRPSSQGALDLAFRADATIADGLQNLTKYARVRAPQISIKMNTKSTGTTLELSSVMDLQQSIWRPLSEVVMLSLQLMLELIVENCGDEIATDKITYEWPWPSPSYVDSIEQSFYGCNIFNSEVCKVFIPKEITDLKSPFYDKTLLDLALQKLEQAESDIFKPKNLPDSILDLLNSHPPQSINAVDVAAMLSMSLRTMNRALKELDTSFRALRDHDLKTRASTLIYTTPLTRDAIAEELGYSDPASLTRACRRWFGTSIRGLRTKKNSEP